MTCSTERLWVK